MTAPEPCRWCGLPHGPRCPHVKALQFDVYGNVSRVEFFGADEVADADGYPKLGG